MSARRFTDRCFSAGALAAVRFLDSSNFIFKARLCIHGTTTAVCAA